MDDCNGKNLSRGHQGLAHGMEWGTSSLDLETWSDTELHTVSMVGRDNEPNDGGLSSQQTVA